MSTCCGVAEMNLRMSRRFIEGLIDVLACGKGYTLSVSLTFQSICVSSRSLSIVTASEQMEQAQEQVQDIEVDADSQQNGR